MRDGGGKGLMLPRGKRTSTRTATTARKISAEDNAAVCNNAERRNQMPAVTAAITRHKEANCLCENLLRAEKTGFR